MAFSLLVLTVIDALTPNLEDRTCTYIIEKVQGDFRCSPWVACVLGYQRIALVDWMLTLPSDLETEFQRSVEQLEAEQRMQYITSFERSGIRQGLLEGIELGLKLKFGSLGLSLLPEISPIVDVEQLRAILAGLETVTTLSELRQIYQPTSI